MSTTPAPFISDKPPVPVAPHVTPAPTPVKSSTPAVKGIPLGERKMFYVRTVDENGSMAPTSSYRWSASDVMIYLNAAPGGSQCEVAVPAKTTAKTFDLTVKGTSSNDAEVSVTVTVPILAATKPVTALTIEQGA